MRKRGNQRKREWEERWKEKVAEMSCVRGNNNKFHVNLMHAHLILCRQPSHMGKTSKKRIFVVFTGNTYPGNYKI